jgi:hypothetical protein
VWPRLPEDGHPIPHIAREELWLPAGLTRALLARVRAVNLEMFVKIYDNIVYDIIYIVSVIYIYMCVCVNRLVKL